MKNNISSTNLMAAMYFMGLSAQYAVEQEANKISCGEETKNSVSPEQFSEILKNTSVTETE